MARPAGARNHDFEEKRAALLDALTEYALSSDLRRPSLRQFAIAAGASEPTLRHYFTDRQGLVGAILENINLRGQALWSAISTPAADPAKAVEEYLRVSEAGMRHGGFSRAHAFGLIEGLADPVAAEAYREMLLEPALRAVMDKIANTPGAPKGEPAQRALALAMFSPLLVISLHQDLLGGAEASPFDTSELIDHLRTWLSAGASDTERQPVA
ncbi:MAG: TetR/AcrR family transcriptional regulator [Pseudomonadota bacterium]